MGSQDVPDASNRHEDTQFITSRLRTWAARFCILALSIYCIGWVIHLSGGFAYIAQLQAYLCPHSPHPRDWQACNDRSTLHDVYEDPLAAIRTEFAEHGTKVFGWPSTGGIWVKEDCYGVELDFLGLDRFHASGTEREADPEAEDAFCQRLQYLGARFCETEFEFNEQRLQRDDRPKLWVGWPGDVPEGGAWVIWLTDVEAAKMGASRIRNALTMKERCEAIKMLGGWYLESWRDVLRSEFAERNDMFYDTEL